MASTASDGTCLLCSTICSKRAMPRHLLACPQREAPYGPPGRQQRLLHLLVQATDMSDYWLHLEAQANATLEDLDDLLRSTWLECCGHLSALTIDKQEFSSFPERGSGERGMSARLDRTLAVGTRFRYEYDFGTTTMLDLRVVAERKGSPLPQPLRLLARNLPPQILCQSCPDVAAWVCVGCFAEPAWLCERCVAVHKEREEHDEGYLLPIVNSPRAGVCAYTGPA